MCFWPYRCSVCLLIIPGDMGRKYSIRLNFWFPSRTGRTLGSGTAFGVDARGYLMTNYHEIESAYRLQQAADDYEALRRNVTTAVLATLGLTSKVQNRTLVQSMVEKWSHRVVLSSPVAARLSGQYYKVSRMPLDMKPEPDVALLHIISMQDGSSTASNDASRATTTVPLLTFGSSSKLFVGQSLMAMAIPLVPTRPSRLACQP
jgi:hypothetical protein